MQIIIVSHRSSASRSITLTGWHLALVALSFVSLVAAAARGLAPVGPAPVSAAPELAAESHAASFMSENVAAMAVRLGQMQAELIRLESLGERLGAMVGIKASEFKPAAPPAQGGPLTSGTALTPAQLQTRMNELSRQIGAKDDYFSVLENELLDRRLRQARLPSTLPVAVDWHSSAFGWRIDPFTGQQAMHEGVDFVADEGTPIVAAATGVVRSASAHPQYGLMLDIDHGQGITTRYAHASQLHVAEGDLVRRGQHIADVGSTGRSTGAHLHFEVRVNGTPQNPERFLAQAGSAQAKKIARR